MHIWKKHEMECHVNCEATLFIDPDDIEDGAKQQILNVMRLPFAKHFAVLPDTHLGYGMPIGGVLATTTDVVIPFAVGSDGGCGMRAMRTSLTADDLTRDELHDLVRMIKERIPVGFKRHSQPCLAGEMPTIEKGLITRSAEEWNKAIYQIGTLGGGNHFIEIQKGSDGYLWVMIHSGSRYLGKVVCDYYNHVAQEKNDRNYSQVPHSWGLAFLHKEDEAYHEYMKDMQYCVEYAHLNRAKMMDTIIDIIAEQPKEPIIDICHNHAQLENHFGHNYMVHRKGVAGPYHKDTLGIIPGSMGTPSYIVKYKDNASPLAMNSTSHGAGRAMGRNQAKKTLNLEAERRKLGGVIHGMRDRNDLDEAPGSYKDIHIVMVNQAELCEVVVELKPLASVKG